ncbi:MAG: hypothetical protein RLZZ200_370 [Pseudomonadota bacterium]|jgi:asparagine synthase (glutamine-hydrolysing)
MTDSLLHRGPDDGGIQALDDSRLWFGHRRLAILDLSPLGHQPMASADGSLWIAFNGEVYNFREIRAELEALGHYFKSHSDTEVILAASREWGLDNAVHKFRGMFAIALWDTKARMLTLCRDRFGVKPLFYAVDNGRLAFASEVRALHAAGFCGKGVDPVALADYVQYGYASAPHSLFKDVRAVQPGHIVTVTDSLTPIERPYWSVRSLVDRDLNRTLRQRLETLSEDALLEELEAQLTEAFEYRMVADVPVGVFLSGGIDSSLVASLLSRRTGPRLRTFTIGYGESEFDETAYARAVAAHLGTEHTEFIVSPTEMLPLLDQALEIADEPIGDSSLIPTLMVSKLAREHVTVALSADGADELFGGYARYQHCARLERMPAIARAGQYLAAEALDRLPSPWIAGAYRALKGRADGFAGIEDKLRKFIRLSRAGDSFERYDATQAEVDAGLATQLGASSRAAQEFARSTFDAPLTVDIETRLMYHDSVRYLPGDLLSKVDRASMAVSLEAREPFLDHKLAEFAYSLPTRWKIQGARNKHILRLILDRHFPAGLFDRPKHGFSAPVRDWLSGPLQEQLRHELSSQRVRDIGLLDPKTTTTLIDDFYAGKAGCSTAGLWFLFQLQRWAGRWLHKP